MGTQWHATIPRGSPNPSPTSTWEQHIKGIFPTGQQTKTVFHREITNSQFTERLSNNSFSLHRDNQFKYSPAGMSYSTITLSFVLLYTLSPALSVPLSRSTREATTPTSYRELWCQLQRNVESTHLASLGNPPLHVPEGMSELVDATCNLTAAYSLLHINGDNTTFTQDLKAYLSELCQEVSTT